MRVFDIRLAGIVIRIQCYYDTTYDLCKNYIVEKVVPDIAVTSSEEELSSFIKTVSLGELPTKKFSGLDIGFNYNYSAFEPFIIYEKIADYMLGRDILLMHGAAIEINNRGYIFTAPSGTGKTTHIMNWCKKIPGTVVVNDDKPLIDVGRAMVYGTPWCGKEGMNINMSAPLSGIISLERGEKNNIIWIGFKEILPQYLRQIYIPKDQELAIQAYELVGKLKDIPSYKLTCNRDEESAMIAYKGLFGVK